MRVWRTLATPALGQGAPRVLEVQEVQRQAGIRCHDLASTDPGSPRKVRSTGRRELGVPNERVLKVIFDKLAHALCHEFSALSLEDH